MRGGLFVNRPNKTKKLMTNLEKTYSIQADLAAVYKALTEVPMIEQWTGSPATMEATEGGTFTMWDGDIHGINRELSASRIEQDWKMASWPSFSKCVFELKAIPEGTQVVLHHTEVPEGSKESVSTGWDEYYFGPLKALLEKSYA